MCFTNRPDFDLESASTSTNAGDKDRITASHNEHKNEINRIRMNETKMSIMVEVIDYHFFKVTVFAKLIQSWPLVVINIIL